MMMQPKTGMLLSSFPILRRTPGGEVINISTSPENESMIMATSPSSRIPTYNDTTRIMTRSEYVATIHNKRAAFLKQHYEDVLIQLSKKLQEDAQAMKSCKIEVAFIVPEIFDRNKVEMIICEYFKYLEYDVIVEESSYDVIRITIQ